MEHLKNVQIETLEDAYSLRKHLALQYTTAILLFRGHEDATYRLESTLVRQNKGLPPKSIAEREKAMFSSFCETRFQDEWLCHKPNATNVELFKLSIARHLGNPCRLIDVTARVETAIWFAVANPEFDNKDGEIIVLIFDKNKLKKSDTTPFSSDGVYYAHEPFMADSICDLPEGEQRRFIQNGLFIWVGDKLLNNEQKAIEDKSLCIMHIKIPFSHKSTLRSVLERSNHKGFPYHV